MDSETGYKSLAFLPVSKSAKNKLYIFRQCTYICIVYILYRWCRLWLFNATFYNNLIIRGRRGRDRMVVGFTTTYAISAYHHWCCEFESWSGRGVQHYVIKFDSDLRQVGGFLLVLGFPLPIKLTATI